MAADVAPHRRALCVWLGTLASWRQGLVGRLVREYGSVAAVVERPPAELAAWAGRRRAHSRRARKPASAATGQSASPEAEAASDARRFADALAAGPEACLRAAERGRRDELLVAWCDPLYPAQLRRLADPPLCLFVRGRAGGGVQTNLAALVTVPAVAVVGTRSPSPYGEDMARMLGRDLTLAGLVVVSGMAMGIDAVAQAAAVDAGVHGERPGTVAVLGCGADVVYPRCNTRLYSAILRSGLVLSEFSWGVPARAWRFPARNRVMAALSRGVVLVEGTERSGARITAGFALDLGREVLCVPGEAGRRLSAAPNLLLRDGAKMCEGAADVLRAIALEGTSRAEEEPDASGRAAANDPWEALVLDHGEGAVRDVLRALTTSSLSIDELASRCRLPAHKVAAAVSELEVDGLARRVEGARYRLLRA